MNTEIPLTDCKIDLNIITTHLLVFADFVLLYVYMLETLKYFLVKFIKAVNYTESF